MSITPSPRPAQRDFGADAVRIAAAVMVLIQHFYMRNGFYYREMTDIWGILNIAMRTVSLSCVPMFLMLTGYLKCGKPWSKKYYASLVPVLAAYLLVSVLSLLFRILVRNESRTAAEWLLEFLGFTLAPYSWYVGMYIGLFLLTPLLNKIWQGCAAHREQAAVVLTMAAVTYLPSTVNALSPSGAELLPAYFKQMYYISYYFLGAYIAARRPKVRQWILWAVILTASLGISVLNTVTRADPADFYSGFSAGYSHILTALISVCLFLSFSQLQCKRERLRRVAGWLSGIAFEIYLCSYFTDVLIFPLFKNDAPAILYFPVGLLMVAAVFVCTAVIAFFVNRAAKAMTLPLFRALSAPAGKAP